MGSTVKTTLVYTTFNRAKQLQRSLERLQRLTLPDEIIVIDDGSGDHTWSVVEEEGRKLKALGVEVRHFYREHPIYDVCSIPRNIALKEATGDIFITCEPECLFVTDVIKEYLDYMEQYPDHVITAGIVYFTNPSTPLDASEIVEEPMNQLAKWDVRPFPNGFYANYPPYVVTKFEYPTAPFSGCYRRDWLLSINGWDEDMSIVNGGGGYGFDDTDLLTRLREKGYNQVRENQITIIHQWHQRPFGTTAHGNTADGWAINEQIMGRKNKTVKNPDGSEFTQIRPEEIVANRTRDWGSLDKTIERKIT